MKTNLTGSWKFHFKEQTMLWSSEMFEIFESSLESALTFRELFDLVHPHDKSSWALAINQASLGHGSSEIICTFILPNGREITIAKTVEAIIENGVAIGLEGICFPLREVRAI